MPRFLTSIIFILLIGNCAFANIDISLSNPSSQTLLVSYNASTDYAAAPFNIWNSQVFTMRWSTSLGGGIITGIQNQSAFIFVLDGVAVDGGDGFYYQKFTAAMTNVNQDIMANTPLPVLEISLFNDNVCAGDFELVTGTPFVNSIFGTASVNNVLGEQFNNFSPALVEKVLLNPSASFETWYADGDGDEKGDPNVLLIDCEQPAGYVSDLSDCDDADPDVPMTPGTPCDDGDPNTLNDMIGANGCDCTGTPVDCPTLGANIGDSCNDNDPTTINDQVNSDCICVGTPTSCTGIGDADGDGVCTDVDCDDNDPQLVGIIGAPCDDGDTCTINDVITAGCGCVGTFQDSDSDGICDINDPCPNGPNPGASCDDGDPTTINDVIQQNCSCRGQFCDITVELNLIEPASCNQDDGAIRSVGVAFSNTVGVVSFVWSNGSSGVLSTAPNAPISNLSQTNLASGTYTITVSDEGGCSSTASATVGLIPNPSVDFMVNNAHCSTVSDGSVSATASGGTPPYSFAWSDGSSSPSLADLSAGAYYLTVSDANGCNTDTSVVVNADPGFSVSLNVDESGCGTTGGSIAANIIGNPSVLTFIWSDGSNDAILDGLSSGTYSVTVIDGFGCSASASTLVCDGIGPDCPLLNLNFSEPCDDGDFCTINDMVQSDCSCAGTFEDSDGDGTCDENDLCLGPEPGSPCDDGNANTVNDMIDPNCECKGGIPNGGITLNCPPDIEVVVPAGISGTVLNFPQPIAISDCNGGGGCTATQVPGFTLMGEFGGSLYYLSSTSKRWEEAQQDCINKGGQLAIITSAAENQFIANHLGYGNAAFIGLTDKNSEGDFSWADGTNLGYSNWDSGEPNNGNGLPENFVVMHGWTLGGWADYNVWVAKPYVLEIVCNPVGGSGNGLTGVQTGGTSTGGFFPIGAQTVSYVYTDNCGNQANCSFQINVIEETQPSGGCNQYENLSLGSQATQSSTRFGALPIRATDGNTSGNFWGTFSVSHTEWEDNPWLEIDLGEIHDLKYINIWNRTDCCQQFLSNLHVLVSDVPFNSTSLDSSLAQQGVSSFYQGGQIGWPTTISTERSGRYVRVQLAGQAFLAMAEIEIWGCPSTNLTGGNGTNLISFNANLNNVLQTDLLWVVRTQNEAVSQIVERSADGVIYSTLSEMKVDEPLNGKTIFQDIDKKPFEGDNYYRLKIIFTDGTFAYSDIKKIVFNPATDFELLPNPASDYVNIYWKRFIGKEVDLVFSNALGQVIYQEHVEAISESIHPVELPRERFKDGVYIVSVIHRGRAISRRLVVVH